MSFGLYISVPFCRSKCTYCNFASGVFPTAQMERYVERLCDDVALSRALADAHRAVLPHRLDSIYLGGGTPSLLPPPQLTKLFRRIATEFDLACAAEITVECAPGTLTKPILESLVSSGVNRVSLGVQSFVDGEAASVARLHTSDQVRRDIEHLRAAGIANINVDLIAGLPHQTRESWFYSLEQVLASGAPHVSVYILEVDPDSRLGTELMAGGAKYHAHSVPNEDLIAEFYETACLQLDANGVVQYEISNFARDGFESEHNLKYWTRQPYLGFGVDAHSMLPACDDLQDHGLESIRLATTDSLDEFLIATGHEAVNISHEQALEESFFLGLRLNRGVDLEELRGRFGPAVSSCLAVIEELVLAGTLLREDNIIRLTPRGRLLSNEVFARFLGTQAQPQIH